jgi:hypothetical protein
VVLGAEHKKELGIMEYWNTGKAEKNRKKEGFPSMG